MQKAADVGIIYKDENFLVINKPAGIVVHKGAGLREISVVDILLKKFPELREVGEDKDRPGIVHRLDKYTSGVMILARNQQSFYALKGLFSQRLIEKIYIALVCGRVRGAQGIISLPVGRLAGNPTKRGVAQYRVRIRGSREAFTKYMVVKKIDDYSLLRLEPKTGRTHQLRVHMKAIGHPIACDTVYGGKKVCCPGGIARPMLHAESISFALEGRSFKFEVGLPADMQKALVSLGMDFVK